MKLQDGDEDSMLIMQVRAQGPFQGKYREPRAENKK